MACSALNSALAIFAGTDFSLASSRIIGPYLSMAKAHDGFPVDEAKWKVTSMVIVVSDSSKSLPATGPGNKDGSPVIPLFIAYGIFIKFC
jgi:hypothetical protein